MRNGVVSERATLEPLTTVNAGGWWPTPTRTDCEKSGNRPDSSNVTLTDVTVRMWGTPMARDDGKTPEAHLEMNRRMGGNRTEVTSLTVQAKMWPTPRAHDGESGSSASSSQEWRPTLKQAAQDMWPTPTASMGDRGTDPDRVNERAGSPTLKNVASRWPSPTARDHKGQDMPGRKSPSLGHLAATTNEDGTGGSARVDLNPWFVACLMGLPMDWLTHSDSEVTVWCRSALQQHGERSWSEQAGPSSSEEMTLWD
jgi:hypothetical protein